MRTVRHPIAIFVIGVVVVIGIGVGVVAATTNQRVYGPSWGRFTAAFPGRVYEFSLTPVTNSNGRRLPTEKMLWYMSLPGRDGWTGYAPLSLTVPTGTYRISVAEGLPWIRSVPSLRQALGFASPDFLGEDVAEYVGYVGYANGLWVGTVGPQCESGRCQVARVVSNGRVLWEMVAASKGPVGTLERFLASFQPTG